MNPRITRRAMLAGVGVATLPFAGARAAAKQWKAYTYQPVTSQASTIAFKRMFDNFQKASGGAVETSLHLGGSLPISATNITQAVSQGLVQLGDDGFNTGNIPISGILRLPMLLLTLDEMLKAMAIVRPYMEKDYTRKRIVMLGQYSYPFQVIFGRKKITSLADINGMKLRVTSVEQGELIHRFGGIPITMGTPDVAAALDRGVVDGALTASSGSGITWKDLLHYRYGFPTSFVNSTFVVNEAAFKTLTVEQQKELRQSADEAAEWATLEMQRQEAEYTANMAKGGMIVTPASQSDIQNAAERMKDYWPSWAKAHGAEAEEVLKKIRQAVGR
jgi:TRAP-type transport system periplasmic protein